MTISNSDEMVPLGELGPDGQIRFTLAYRDLMGVLDWDAAAITPVDQARSSAHDALNSSVAEFNRTAGGKLGWEPEGKLPVGGVFSFDPDILVESEQNRV